MKWVKKPLDSGAERWLIEGLEFLTEVVEDKEFGEKAYAVRCEGFDATGGIPDLVSAKELAVSYAKQRVVQIMQTRLAELNELAVG